MTMGKDNGGQVITIFFEKVEIGNRDIDAKRCFLREAHTRIDNSDGQAPDAYKSGDYFLVNVMHYPVAGVMMGGEYQWGRRTNFSDGFHSDGSKIQFSFKYNFSFKLGG